jgi:hypothetical protein
MAAREKDDTGTLSFTILIVVAGNAVVFAYLLVTGRESLLQAGPPLIINLVLALLLFLFRRQEAVHAPRHPR